MVGRPCMLLAMLRVLSSAQTGSIQGHVVDAADAVIPNADVELRTKADGTLVQNTRTDWSGRFVFTALAPGTYDLIVSALGFDRHSESIKLKEEQETDLLSISLAVAPIGGCGPPPLGPPTIYSDSTNSDEADLYGTVAGVSGEFIERVRVSLLPISNHGRAVTMVTGPDNSFYFSGIAPGVYALRATRQGYADFVIDRLELKAGQGVHIIEPLEMLDCLKGFRCKPNRKVHIIELCL
jgi:hypothetical protein